MDIEHYFTETGNGEPLILLHGNGEDDGVYEISKGVWKA